jgi:hypothetical protein
MKKAVFEEPLFDVVRFQSGDVIVTSPGGQGVEQDEEDYG